MTTNKINYLFHIRQKSVKMISAKVINFKIVLIAILITIANGFPKNFANQDQEDPAVTRFRNYLRINTAHPTPDYESAITWVRGQAAEIGLDFNLEYFEPTVDGDVFAMWLTWNGTNPSLKSILVNSHIDVVAVDHSKWDHDPFEAYKDEEGNIFGRGALDMKSATVGILEAVRRLKISGFQPLRTIHFSIMPDEEVGSIKGMKRFVNTPQFANLNIGFSLDEGFVSQTGDMFITYAEKSIWQFNVTARGISAHGSTLPVETAGQKLERVIAKLMEFRDSQLQQLDDPNVTIQNLTSINLVKLGGGIGNNIIPDELWASFDMRILLKPEANWNFTDVENMLMNITQGAGANVTFDYIQKGLESGQTAVDETNVWWTSILRTCNQLEIKCVPQILSAATDGRFVRNLGIPVFGLNPFLYTDAMEHQDNEKINEVQFLNGIDRYAAFIQSIASVL